MQLYSVILDKFVIGTFYFK